MTDTSFPATIYLDTSVVATAIFPGLAHSVASADFCAAAARAGTRAYFSQILWLELSQVLMKLPHGQELPDEVRRRYRLGRWDTNFGVRQRWIADGIGQFERFLAQFSAVNEAPFERSIWEASFDVMARTQLRSHDAIHVATARDIGVPNFVTVDDHFRRVPDLRVWLMRDAGP